MTMEASDGEAAEFTGDEAHGLEASLCLGRSCRRFGGEDCGAELRVSDKSCEDGVSIIGYNLICKGLEEEIVMGKVAKSPDNTATPQELGEHLGWQRPVPIESVPDEY